ncbi:MAG: DUF736 domain-containing protein [Pseudomonadota bacterium]
MAAIGYVTHHPERGTYKGTLKTLTIACGIELIPNREKESDKQPDFRIFSDERTEIGAGWNRKGKNSGRDYVSLTFAAPELGPRKLYANLGPAAGQDDPAVFAIIWNPEG